MDYGRIGRFTSFHRSDDFAYPVRERVYGGISVIHVDFSLSQSKTWIIACLGMPQKEYYLVADTEIEALIRSSSKRNVHGHSQQS